MRSRRHMLNNIGNKPTSNHRDSNLIGGGKPVKAQQLPPKPNKTPQAPMAPIEK